MSSKAARRRTEKKQRDRRRQINQELKKAWTCVCGDKMEGQFPICLCGRLRPEPRV